MLLIAPTHYTVRGHDNPYVQEDADVSRASQQHATLVSFLPQAHVFQSPHRDAVFVANSALILHHLPRVALLSSMKYAHRKLEISPIRKILHSLHYTTFQFPTTHIFEGQGETKWFGNTLFCGYGHRATRSSCDVLQRVLHTIYSKYNMPAPQVVPLRIEDSYFYHLDIAMLKLSETSCIVHKRAFSPKTIEKIREFIPTVHVLSSSDTLCLNSVIIGDTLLTNKLSSTDQQKIKRMSGLRIQQIDTSAFNASGGGVRCMILDL